jgi:hypothetical protein
MLKLNLKSVTQTSLYVQLTKYSRRIILHHVCLLDFTFEPSADFRFYLVWETYINLVFRIG